MLDNPNATKMNVRFLSMRDDEYLFEKAEYWDVKEAIEPENLSNELTNLTNIVNKHVKYQTFHFQPVGAFSMNWPFFAFSGSGKYIYVLNAFFKKRVIRI
jgi:hypothetical protein